MAIFRAFTPGRGGIIELSPASINAIESYIEWCENEVPSQVASKMDVLVNMMALVNQSIARKMSFGPYDPTGMKTDLSVAHSRSGNQENYTELLPWLEGAQARLR